VVGYRYWQGLHTARRAALHRSPGHEAWLGSGSGQGWSFQWGTLRAVLPPAFRSEHFQVNSCSPRRALSGRSRCQALHMIPHPQPPQKRSGVLTIPGRHVAPSHPRSKEHPTAAPGPPGKVQLGNWIVPGPRLRLAANHAQLNYGFIKLRLIGAYSPLI
jgi:hypothetical protein